MVLVDVYHCVLGSLKCLSCSVFFLQTEHLPLQTQFKEREVGGLQHSVSNEVLLWGSAQVDLLLYLLKYHLISMKIAFFFHLSAI